jgi:4'-phosphopantetheinyl transferase
MNTEHFIPSIVPVEQVADLWNEYDVLIFIIDLNDYPTPSADYLNEVEKAHLDALQTEYFKKRYITSRMFLKHLSGVLKERSWSDIVTYKDGHGRVHVCDHNDLHVCISYTENIVALAISKIDMGIDIEVIKSRSVTSISKSINKTLTDSSPSAYSSDFLVMWTLKEAYCKLSNETMFSNLNRKLDLSDVHHSSYVVDNKYMLALVTKSDGYKVNIVRLPKIDFLKA